MKMQSFLHSVGEAITPVLKNSKFKETGVLTPEEFVAAGDFLVYKCPTWAWASGEEKLRRPYLPPEKQFLITKNVPCFKRVKSVEYVDDDEMMVDGGDTGEWVDTFHSQHKTGLEEVIKDMSVQEPITVHEGSSSENSDDDEDIPDIDEFVDDNLEDDDAAVAVREDDNILKTRTYDLSITYDKYYQTPRMWLFGYDEHRRPLTQAEMFEDFSQDHAKKTVTMEQHPHLSLTMASIHPCRHANVMKRIIDNLAERGRDQLQVHMYLMIFLKFVSAVIPTIEYDYTREFTM